MDNRNGRHMEENKSQYIQTYHDTEKTRMILFQDKNGKARDNFYTTAKTMPMHDIDLLKNGDCTAIPNEFLLNCHISIEAKGLLGVILGRRWFVTCVINGNKSYIRDTFTGLSKNTYTKYIDELIGYNIFKLHEAPTPNGNAHHIELLPRNEWILPEVEKDYKNEEVTQNIPASNNTPYDDCNEYIPF